MDAFAAREVTLKSLKQQQAVYDNRLSVLQQEHARLEAEWSSLTFNADSVGTRDIRQLDEAVVDADVKLAAAKCVTLLC